MWKKCLWWFVAKWCFVPLRKYCQRWRWQGAPVSRSPWCCKWVRTWCDDGLRSTGDPESSHCCGLFLVLIILVVWLSLSLLFCWGFGFTPWRCAAGQPPCQRLAHEPAGQRRWTFNRACSRAHIYSLNYTRVTDNTTERDSREKLYMR